MTKSLRLFLVFALPFLILSLRPQIAYCDDDDNVAISDNGAENGTDGDATHSAAEADPDEQTTASEWEKSAETREKKANTYIDEEMNHYDNMNGGVPQPDMHTDVAGDESPRAVSSSDYSPAPAKKHHAHNYKSKSRHAAAYASHHHKSKKRGKLASRSKKHSKRKTAKSSARHRYARN